MRHCCVTCRWAWPPDPGTDHGEGLEAECRRFPPQVVYAGAEDSYTCMWPAVGYEHCCGEWASDMEEGS